MLIVDGPKRSTITSKRKNQRDTRRRHTFRLLRTDGTDTSDNDILKQLSNGVKDVGNIWIRSCQLISHIQLQGKNVSDLDRSLDQ